MGRQTFYVVLALLFSCLFQLALCREADIDRLDRNERLKRPRVDAGVKRPYRVCQGFEDPEDVDCYLRSDLKTYICVEPAAFNPCQSSRTVTTYHYDHIKHRCGQVILPACSGYIIRAMTLIQCLVYCHNNDPFALGKSTSMIYKLNQKKPYIQKEAEIEQRERAISFIDDAENKLDSKLTEVNDASKHKGKMAKKNLKLNMKSMISDAGLTSELLKDFSETATTNTDKQMTKTVNKHVKDFLNSMIKMTKINADELTPNDINLKARKKDPITKEKADQKKSILMSTKTEVVHDGMLRDRNKKKTAIEKHANSVEKKKTKTENKMNLIEKNVAKGENKKENILKLKVMTPTEKKELKIKKDAKKEITDKGKVSTEKKKMETLDIRKEEAVKDIIPIDMEETKGSVSGKKDSDQSYKVKGLYRNKDEVYELKDLANWAKDAKFNTKLKDKKKENEANDEFYNNEKRGKSEYIESLEQRENDLHDRVINGDSTENSERSINDEKDTVKVEDEKKVIDLSEPTEIKEKKHAAESFSKKEHRVNQLSIKGMDAIHKSDSKDKSDDDGFYLWDE